MSMILILNLIHNTVPTEFVIALPEFWILIFRPQPENEVTVSTNWAFYLA